MGPDGWRSKLYRSPQDRGLCVPQPIILQEGCDRPSAPQRNAHPSSRISSRSRMQGAPMALHTSGMLGLPALPVGASPVITVQGAVFAGAITNGSAADRSEVADVASAKRAAYSGASAASEGGNLPVTGRGVDRRNPPIRPVTSGWPSTPVCDYGALPRGPVASRRPHRRGCCRENA